MNKITISKRDLHLAAYIKAHGGELTGYKNGSFHFESDVEWRVQHASSDALRVDQELLVLRRFVL
jgi:uncharacterized protein involved in high-affinity Fe2+ transport